MEPYKTKIFILLLLFSSQYVFAGLDPIIIKGKIDTSITKANQNYEISIRLNNSASYLDQSDLLNFPVKADGTFLATIKPLSRHTYLSFWIINKNKESPNSGNLLPIAFPARIYSKLQELYLFEHGDSVRADFFKSGNIIFRGKGAEKLDCQVKMYSIEDVPSVVSSRESQLVGDTALTLLSSVLEHTKKIRLAIIESYKYKFSDSIFRLLQCDATSLSEYYLLSGLPYRCTAAPTAINAHSAIRYFEKHFMRENASLDTGFLSNSAFLADVLFEREFNFTRLFNNNGNFTRGDSFEAVYQRIKRSYKGLLRDKMLLICFQQLNLYYPDEARLNVDDAIQVTESDIYKKLLESWANKQFKAYPFKLTDASGKVHSLADYKGKILVIDYWFTGCSWCANLNAVMQVIAQNYEANKHVIFMTISVDQNKNKWVKSVAANLYCSDKSVNLFTNGEGVQNMAYKYYNYVGAPQQLIIGKNGEIVSSHPPRPDLGPQELLNKIFSRNAETGIVKADQKLALSNPNAIAFMDLLDKSLRAPR